MSMVGLGNYAQNGRNGFLQSVPFYRTLLFTCFVRQKKVMRNGLGASNGPAEQRRASVFRAGIRRRPTWRMFPLDKEPNVRFQEARRVLTKATT